MRFGLLISFLAAIMLIVALVVPARQNPLALSLEPSTSTPSSVRCIALTYTDAVRSRGLPHRITLRPDTTSWVLGRLTYRAEGDGDPLWRQAWWAFAGPDSIDLTAHHQATIRLPAKSGTGRAVPYVDGSLLNALISRGYRTWSVDQGEIPS